MTRIIEGRAMWQKALEMIFLGRERLFVDLLAISRNSTHGKIAKTA